MKQARQRLEQGRRKSNKASLGEVDLLGGGPGRGCAHTEPICHRERSVLVQLD